MAIALFHCFAEGDFFAVSHVCISSFLSQNGTTRKPVSACNRCDGRSQIRSETVILAACFHLLCACACQVHEAQLCRLHCRLCTAGFAAGFIYRSTLSYISSLHAHVYTDIHRGKVHACNLHITHNERTIMRMTSYPHGRDQCMAVRNTSVQITEVT